jgi:pentatricopeptide repeat protein
MDGIKINGVRLEFTKLPYRKQECIIISDDYSGVILGYVKADVLEKAKTLWQEMLDGVK